MLGLTYEQKVERLNAAWRAERGAPLTVCQSSWTDGECVHKKCPFDRKKHNGCPLPGAFHYGDSEDDE